MKFPLNRQVSILGAICVGLAGATYWELTRSASLTPQTHPSAATTSQDKIQSSTPKLNMPALGDFSEISARPVFFEARRPVPPKPPPVQTAAPPKAAPVPPPQITLMGVILDPDHRLVILRSKDSPEAKLLKEGDSVDGWLLAQIADDHIVLESGDRRQEFAFPKPSSVSSSSATKPPARGIPNPLLENRPK